MKFKLTALAMIVFSALTSAFGQKAVTTTEPAAAKLPSVSEVLSKYVAAIGGREANEKIKSRHSKGTVELSPMGIKGGFETVGAPDSKLFTKMNLAGIGEMLEGSDGKTAWTQNPIQGGREKEGKELQQAMIAANFYREINLDKLYGDLKVTGTATVEGKEAYVVEAMNEGLPAEKFYFDTKTGYLLRSDATLISPEGNQPATIHYDDVREVDGVKLPFKIRTKLPQFEVVVVTSEVKHNLKVEDTTFARPK